MKKAEIIKTIKDEIEWCTAHRGNDSSSAEYRKGFVMGLKQLLAVFQELKDES